ncbi:hypothetical protein BH09PAT1_BH09PAT1_1310 [soil metagenome]
MQNFSMRNNYFYLALGIIIIIIYAVVTFVVVRNNSEIITKESVLATPTPNTTKNSTPIQIRRPEPPVTSSLTLGKPGIFVIGFPAAVRPSALTTTIVESDLDTTSPTLTVPFTATFSADVKTMTIKTTAPVTSNKYYSVYVRLTSNNHIVVKKRFESTATQIIPLNDSL